MPDDVLGSLQTMLLLVAVLFFYFGLVLTLLARKTATPGAWMAWIPIANFVLLCRIGRKSAAYLLLMLIPLVNIVAVIVVWMGVAKACGKSSALGVLMIVPGLNLVVPFLLLTGPAPARQSSTVTPASAPGTRTPGPQVCPVCGWTECVGEAFCGTTGQPIPAAPRANPSAPANPVASPAPSSAATAGMALGALVLLAGLGYWMFASPSGTGSSLTQGQVPKRVAGTLKEFPVDTTTNPAKPTSVTIRNLRVGKAKLPPKSLPPGITDAKLAEFATTATSATYQTTPQDSPVNVHVLASEAGPQSRDLATDIAAASGGGSQTTGVHVTSPAGGEYDGFKIRTPVSVTYVFDKIGDSIVVLLYSSDVAGIPLADRLAANIGNGEGLLDDAEASASLGALPSALPDGVELIETSSYSGDEVIGSLDQLKSSLGVTIGPDAETWLKQLQSLLPPRINEAHYRDPSKNNFDLVYGDYGGSLRAWATWMAVRAASGSSGLSPVPLAGGDAMSGTSDGKDYVVFRRGSLIGVSSGAPGGTALRLAEGVQP